MNDFNFSAGDRVAGADELLPENVYGHTKKVQLFREAIERFRRGRVDQNLNILDIGCGSGYAVTRFLHTPLDRVTGVDMFEPNIDYANANYARRGIEFLCVDANTLSVAGRRFEFVVLADVLEHLDDPASVLKLAASLLAPEGRILVTVPNGIGPFEQESALANVPILGPLLLKAVDLFVAFLDKTLFKGVWTAAVNRIPKDLPYNIENGHVQFFRRKEIEALLRSTGLEIVQSANLSFLSGPFSNYLLAPFAGFCAWNTRTADKLPAALASAWYFECKLHRQVQSHQ